MPMLMNQKKNKHKKTGVCMVSRIQSGELNHGPCLPPAPTPPLHASTHVKPECAITPISPGSSCRKYKPSGRTAGNQRDSQVGFRGCKPRVMVGEGVRNGLPGRAGEIQLHHRRGKPHQSLDIGSRDPARG